MNKESSKIVVGSEEWCAFPSLGIPMIKARVDSGAKTSSMHAFNIQKFRRDGESWISFEVHPLQNDRRTVIRCERPVLDKRVVKSSSGVSETRYVIGATIKAGAEAWDIELTLAN
ncbi:MAG: RimK/LysX family protein, partial [Gammaproteobacteria bacterium]